MHIISLVRFIQRKKNERKKNLENRVRCIGKNVNFDISRKVILFLCCFAMTFASCELFFCNIVSSNLEDKHFLLRENILMSWNSDRLRILLALWRPVYTTAKVWLSRVLLTSSALVESR